jgi:hypothetical protein
MLLKFHLPILGKKLIQGPMSRFKCVLSHQCGLEFPFIRKSFNISLGLTIPILKLKVVMHSFDLKHVNHIMRNRTKHQNINQDMVYLNYSQMQLRED